MRRRRALQVGVATISTLLLACGSDVIVHLVRHAEKAAGDGVDKKDPPLSEKGKERAEALVVALAAKPITAVFATEYRRTQETVEAVATAKNLTVKIVNANDTKELVRLIREHAGKEVLVAGHSNTVPEIAKELGLTEELALDDDAFGDWFILRAASKSASVERKRFEPGS